MDLNYLYQVHLWRNISEDWANVRQSRENHERWRVAVHNNQVERDCCYKARYYLAVSLSVNERFYKNLKHNEQVIEQQRSTQTALAEKQDARRNNINTNLKIYDNAFEKIKIKTAHLHALNAAIAAAGEEGENYVQSLHPAVGRNAIDELRAKFKQEYLDGLAKKS